MKEKIKILLFTNWHFMRWFRLVLSVLIAIQAVYMANPWLGFFSAFFMFQALTNTGCCGTAGCATNTRKVDDSKKEEVVFEEVK